MKINKFKISSILYFKSGNSKKVDWVEERLVKKVKGETSEITESLTLTEADVFFQGKFKEWKEKGATIVRKNIKGDNSMIPFSEVEYATVSVEQLDDEINSPQPETDTVPPPPPFPYSMERRLRNIQDHPAYRENKTN